MTVSGDMFQQVVNCGKPQPKQVTGSPLFHHNRCMAAFPHMCVTQQPSKGERWLL